MFYKDRFFFFYFLFVSSSLIKQPPSSFRRFCRWNWGTPSKQKNCRYLCHPDDRPLIWLGCEEEMGDSEEGGVKGRIGRSSGEGLRGLGDGRGGGELFRSGT